MAEKIVERVHQKTPLIRNDSTLNVYHGMLAHFSPREVADFFRENALSLGGRQLSLKETIERIHSPNQKLSAAYGYEIMREAERFCCLRGLSLSEFAQTCICRVRRGNLLPLRLFVRYFIPLLDTITGEGDLRHSFLRIGSQTVRLTSRHALLQVCCSTLCEGWYDEVLCYTPDRTFRHRLPLFNVDQFLGLKLQVNPRVFGHPDYEDLTTIASCRSLAEIVGLHEIAHDALAAEMKRMPFSLFLRERGLVVPSLPGMPDPSVVVAPRSLSCPRCATPLFHAGVAYGAPLHLFRVHYRALRKRRNTSALAATLTHAAKGNIRLESVSAAHGEVLWLAAQGHMSVTYHYDRDADKMFRCGLPVTRGMQARMLRVLLSRNLTENQTLFSRQFLLAEPTVGFDPLNPNFEVRMRRLMRIVDAKCEGLRISKVEQGLYRLDVGEPIEFTET